MPSLKRQLAPKHIEERLKLGANGLQATCITMLAGALLAPAINATLITPIWTKIAAAIIAGSAELVAFKILAYIPIIKEPQP